MRTLKISLIATLIATGLSFWVGRLGVTQKIWPLHPQWAGFFLTLVTCIVVQIVWPKEWLGGQRDKN
jgi:hypothetical protein